MTKAIEDELNLPRLEDALAAIAAEQPEEQVNLEVEKMANALQNVDTAALPSRDPTGVSEHENEADEIIKLAMSSYKDLFDLGFNIEPKNAGANAFSPAAKFLELALKASQSKTDRKMEKIKAVMEQEKHRKEMGEGVEDGEIVESGASIVANRNDLMDKIRKGEI
jgi:hypothetical protein